MKYYFISFWLYDMYWNNGFPMPPALVEAADIHEAYDKIRNTYTANQVGTFADLTIR